MIDVLCKMCRSGRTKFVKLVDSRGNEHLIKKCHSCGEREFVDKHSAAAQKLLDKAQQKVAILSQDGETLNEFSED